MLRPHSRHPDDLYKNGIQRSSFMPCIELLKERFEVTDLDSGTGGSALYDNLLFPPDIAQITVGYHDHYPTYTTIL